MANTKKSFQGIKQVLKATYDAAVTSKKVAGYIWFVRENASAVDGDIYFGSRHYGHFSANELSTLETTLKGLINENKASIANLKSAIEALDVNDAAVEGQYVSAVKQEDGKISVSRVSLPSVEDAAVAGQYVSAVSETNGKITVTRASLPASKVDGVAADDKVLVLGDNKLISATVSLSYGDGATGGEFAKKKTIKLLGKNNTVISEIDATEFIKDGMLNSASFDEKSHILSLSFNTDAGVTEPITVDLSTLVDTYKAGTGLTLATDGTFSLNNATVASLSKADSAIQTVSGDADTFAVVGTKDASNGVKISNKIQKVSTASSTAKGLAEASDVKAELDKKVNAAVGSRLMTNDEGTKLANIADGAQVNVLEGIEGSNAIEVSGISSKKQTVSLKIDTTTAGNVTLSQGANGLKASVEIPAAKVDSIASNDKTITVSNNGAAWNVVVNKASVPLELGEHNIFLENGTDGALYGVMYYDGDDVE